MDSFVLETSSGKLCIMLYYKRPATDPCIRDEARLAALSARCVFLFSFPNHRSLSKYPRPLLYHVTPHPRSRSRSCLTKNLPSPSSSSTIIFSKLLSSLREIDVLRYVVSNKLLTRHSIRNEGCDVMVKNIKARARIVERFLILKISRLGLMAREGEEETSSENVRPTVNTDTRKMEGGSSEGRGDDEEEDWTRGVGADEKVAT